MVILFTNHRLISGWQHHSPVNQTPYYGNRISPLGFTISVHSLIVGCYILFYIAFQGLGVNGKSALNLQTQSGHTSAVIS
jgi:hypothetical protein